MKDETLGEPKREMEYNLFKLARKTFRPMTVEGSGDMTPPVAPVVTDEMVQAANLVVDTMLRHGSDMNFSENDIMRAAITAALESSGELERLRTAAKLALDAFYKCVEWSGTTDFDHEIAALEAALDKLTGESREQN